MEHINIFLIFFNLIVGVGTAIYSFQLYKTHRLPYLKYLFNYIICYNLIVIVDLSFKYILINMYNNDLSGMSRYLISSLLITIILAEFLTVTTLYYFLAGLGNYKRSGKTTILLASWGVSFGIAHIYSFWIFIKRSSEILFYTIHEFWIFSMLIFIFVILISHIFKSLSMSNLTRRPNLEFAIIFIIGYFFYSFDQVDFYFLKMRISLLSPLTLLFANVCPTVWLLFCFPKYYSTFKESIADIILPKSMKNFMQEFNISDREGEIIEQIYFGRSNKEIEDILFISFSTVKNHIFNIYQKTGVHSRSQLISLIRSLDKTST